MEQIYDMIVIGGGPAGYTAALYAARSRAFRTLVLEKLSAGGQMALTEQIDNYPGFEDGIDGFTLGEKMQQSAERFGAVTELAEVYKVSLSGKIKTLDTSEGVFQSRTVVIATGASPRPLGVPGEEALAGKGVHYCAACDGAPYRGKTVAVVGGGNSAAADALALSRIAQKVYLIHRRDSLRATKVYHEPLMNAPNVEFCWNSTVSALLHDKPPDGASAKRCQHRRRTRPCLRRRVHQRGTRPGDGAVPRRAGAGQVRLYHRGRIHPHQPPRRVRRGRCAHQGAAAGGHRRIGRRGGCPLRRGISGGESVKRLRTILSLAVSCPQATRLRALPHRGAG